MLKCPFCQYDNEDGALFCEQCKSDLGVLESGPAPSAVAVPVREEAAPVALAVESPSPKTTASIPVASPVGAEDAAAGPIPVARPLGPSRDSRAETVEAAAAAYTEMPLALSAESGMESPLGPGDTVGSLKTFIPPSGARKSPEQTSAQGAHAPRADPHVTRDTDVLPTGGNPRLLVLRGQKINVEYPIYDGDNFIGRADEKPVDIDLEDQEPPDRIWSSRQHALVRCEAGILVIEDLNSSNGTFINRTRLYPGQKRVLNVNDVIQIGTVQMKVIIH
jgi:FHA domain